jgi:hypothetical protein
MVVDGDACGRRRRCDERWLPVSLAGNSGCNRVLRDEGTMVDLILHSNGNGGGRWWRLMVSRVTCSAEQSRGEGGHARGGNKVWDDSSTAPTRGNKVANPRGAAVTDLTDERRCLCHERGHHLVTHYVAAGMGLGNRVARLSRFGPRPLGRPTKNFFQLFKFDLSL